MCTTVIATSYSSETFLSSSIPLQKKWKNTIAFKIHWYWEEVSQESNAITESYPKSGIQPSANHLKYQVSNYRTRICTHWKLCHSYFTHSKISCKYSSTAVLDDFTRKSSSNSNKRKPTNHSIGLRTAIQKKEHWFSQIIASHCLIDIIREPYIHRWIKEACFFSS